MQALARYIMRGRGHTVAVVAIAAALSVKVPLFGILAGSAPALVLFSLAGMALNLISGAAAALVTLRQGPAEGLRVLGWAIPVMAVIGMLAGPGDAVALPLAVLQWLPVVLLALVLRESGSLRSSLVTAFGFGFLAVIGVYSVAGDVAGRLMESMQQGLATVPADRLPDDPENIKDYWSVFSHFVTGSLVGVVVGGWVMVLLLARCWQAALYNPGGFRAEFIALRMPTWLAYLGLGLLGLAWLQQGWVSEVAWNLVILLSLLFLVGGLAVLHGILANSGSRRLMLTGVYLALFLLFPHAPIWVGLLGFSDVWLDWRSRHRSR
ncbi:MAG: hypothetical protein FIA97_15670 [Methylococcaceae bacterium]|nr:hypothetical protein [Methylococcaceae bacterium]